MQPIILLIILIFLNAAFASAEIAVISMNEARLRKRAEEGDRRAVKLMSLTEQPARFLATIQVAITLASYLQSAFAAENFAGPLVSWLKEIGIAIPESILKAVCIAVITLVLAYFNLIFGELVPKRIAMKKADSLALAMSGILYAVSKVFAPLVWLLTASTNFVLRLLGMGPDEKEDVVTEEEIRMLLVEGNEKGTIRAEENEIIQNVFDFNDLSVEEICTHRREIEMLFVSDGEEDWERQIFHSRHTFYPVCGKDQDDILGVLNTKDYFRAEDKAKDSIMACAVEPAFFIPENMKANVLFREMKQSRRYFAVVLDEYGGLSGIITLHDLMESLVGELDEEEDVRKPEDIEEIGSGRWIIQGCADLDEVAETVKKDLPTEVYDTFNGYVCGIIGRVPQEGENFVCEDSGLRIEVHGVMNHMIKEATVYFSEKTEDSIQG